MFKRLALVSAGWIAITLGAAGLFLPVLPGILLLLVGLWILSSEYHWARRWSTKLRERFPEAARKCQRLFRTQRSGKETSVGDASVLPISELRNRR